MKQVSTGTGHTIAVKFSATGSITVFYDGNEVARASTGFLGFVGANGVFNINENGSTVTYECSTRPALAFDAHLTVRRNGVVIYTD